MLRTRLKALAAQRRRFGYRRLHLLLRREGFTVNHKKLFRIYRQARLVARKPGGRKRALGTRAPAAVPGEEPAMVAGLRLGHIRGRAPLPHARHRR